MEFGGQDTELLGDRYVFPSSEFKSLGFHEPIVSMVLKLAAYAIAFISLAAIGLPFLPLSWKVAIWLRSAKGLTPYVFGALDLLMNVVAIAFATWAIGAIGSEPTWLMFIIPGMAMCMHDLDRVRFAKRGISGVRRLFERSGEPESYDQDADISIERARFTGDILGWFLGVALFLKSVRFF